MTTEAKTHPVTPKGTADSFAALIVGMVRQYGDYMEAAGSCYPLSDVQGRQNATKKAERQLALIQQLLTGEADLEEIRSRTALEIHRAWREDYPIRDGDGSEDLAESAADTVTGSNT